MRKNPKCCQIKMPFFQQVHSTTQKPSDHDLLNKYETRRGLYLYIACHGKKVDNMILDKLHTFHSPDCTLLGTVAMDVQNCCYGLSLQIC